MPERRWRQPEHVLHVFTHKQPKNIQMLGFYKLLKRLLPKQYIKAKMWFYFWFLWMKLLLLLFVRSVLHSRIAYASDLLDSGFVCFCCLLRFVFCLRHFKSSVKFYIFDSHYCKERRTLILKSKTSTRTASTYITQDFTTLLRSFKSKQQNRTTSTLQKIKIKHT